MLTSVDKKTLASAIALPDLTEMEVSDVFYRLRKIHPLDLMVTHMHGPRKYYAKSKRSYKTSLALDNRQEIIWNDLIFEMALNLVFTDTERQLNSLKSKCEAKSMKLPHNLFSWSIKDKINRLDLSNDLYVDLIELNYASDFLDEIKLQVDLTQVLEIYNQIASDFMDDIDLDKELIPTLKEYAKCDEYQTKLNIQFEYAKQEYQKLMESYNRNLLFPPAKLKEVLLPRLARLQLINMQSEALIPIHDRYKVNWFKTNAYFKIFKNSKSLQKTKNKIKEYTSVKIDEEECTQSKLSMYNSQLLNYMGNYDMLIEKYDDDYEVAENEVAILRAKINKAREDYKFFMDQVVFFKKSIKQTLETIKREELEEQQKLEIQSAAPIQKRKSKPKKNKK